MHNFIIGWDIGGAHLKAALVDQQGRLMHVVQVACPLWRGLNELRHALNQIMTDIKNQMPVDARQARIQHAITMTGELVDLFVHRQQGVIAISEVMRSMFAQPVWFYTMLKNTSHQTRCFVPFEQVAHNWQHIASANWHASGALLAQSVKAALLIDIGSTTSDFITLHGHDVIDSALTDAERMQAQTLIYTGVVRTPVMTLCQTVTFNAQLTTVAAEYFATTADIYRLTGDLLEADDMADTADQQAKTMAASATRLARMIGRDAIEADLTAWQSLARAFKRAQFERLFAVTRQHLNAFPFINTQTKKETLLLGAGAGRFLVKEIAQQLDLPYQEVSTVMTENLTSPATVANDLMPQASLCLPAVAVATLLAQTRLPNHS